MTAGERLFGTDGIRGRVGTNPITPSFAYHLGRVIAIHTLRPDALVYVGRDTRESSQTLESYLALGIREGGARIESLGVLPTPGISYCTKQGPADFGVAITASHNPHDYNGFKLFSSDGTKLDEQSEHQIEQGLNHSDRRDPEESLEALAVSHTSRNPYLEILKNKAVQIGPTGLKAVVDCAHGAATTVAVHVFEGIFKDAHFIGNSPNGININRGVGSTSIDAVQRSVIDLNADIGITFDGDGDRVLFIDDQGDLIGGDQVLYLLAKRHLVSNQDRNGVVGTIMSNHGLQLALEEIGIPFVRTDVGDKNVFDELASRHWRLGGEPSGHIIWRDVADTGDGVLIALSVVEAVQHEGLPLRQLVTSMSMLPQAQLNVPSPNAHTSLQKPNVKDVVAKFKSRVLPGGRLLVRASGTEPLLRVMVEHREAATANRLADELAHAISVAIRQ